MGGSSTLPNTSGVETSVRHERRLPQPALVPTPPEPSGGADGNERLTAGAAVVLFVLLAVEGVTIVFLRPLFSVHVFVGMLLIPPVALKLGSTGWRFFRYYTGRQEYVRKGPPLLPLRLLAPVVVLSTLAVFATGVALLVVGPRGGVVLGLHKASFVVWLVATGIHVLAYLTRVPKLASGGLAAAAAAARRHVRPAQPSRRLDRRRRDPRDRDDPVRAAVAPLDGSVPRPRPLARCCSGRSSPQRRRAPVPMRAEGRSGILGSVDKERSCRSGS